MGHWRGASLVLVAVLLVAGGSARAADDSGGTAIFDGKTLAGWVAEGVSTYLKDGGRQPIWQARDGILVCEGKGFGFLRYDKPLGDFRVHLEYRMTKGCNSGVGIRSEKYTGAVRTRPSFSGYEIQIMDDVGQPPTKKGTGSLYRYVAPSSNPVKGPPEWNTLDVECVGPRIVVRLNGVTIQDVDQTKNPEIAKKPLRGYLSLQNHGRTIEFRNLRLTELGGGA